MAIFIEIWSMGQGKCITCFGKKCSLVHGKLGKQSTKGHDNLKIKMMYVVMLKGKIVLGMMAKN